MEAGPGWLPVPGLLVTGPGHWQASVPVEGAWPEVASSQAYQLADPEIPDARAPASGWSPPIPAKSGFPTRKSRSPAKSGNGAGIAVPNFPDPGPGQIGIQIRGSLSPFFLQRPPEP